MIIGSLACCAPLVVAQVAVDVPIRMTGAPSDRQVQDLGPPTDATALGTVEGSIATAWRWTTAQAQGNALALDAEPDVSAYRDGLLLRFLAPVAMSGNLTVSVDGLTALPFVRPDGSPPVMGQVQQGVICEVMQAQGRFILMSAAERGCPPTTVRVNERFCIDQASVPNLLFREAADRCAVRGGKLCTWDEYHAACVLVLPQLTGMFDEWEWMDDTSNHTYTVDQVGRASCNSQRSQGVPTERTGDTRCCYHPR